MKRAMMRPKTMASISVSVSDLPVSLEHRNAMCQRRAHRNVWWRTHLFIETLPAGSVAEEVTVALTDVELTVINEPGNGRPNQQKDTLRPTVRTRYSASR